MTPEEAIEYVAQQVMADLSENAFDCWDGYPEIGEHDWDRVTATVMRLALVRRPSASRFLEAYALLSARAENDK